jgi:hypothetical protein
MASETCVGDSENRRRVEAASGSPGSCGGAVEEFGVSEIFEMSRARSSMLGSQVYLETIGRFRMPEMGEAARLLQQLNETRLTPAFQGISAQREAIERAMGVMRTPFIDPAHSLRSVTGFAELQSIGQTLRGPSLFGDNVAGRLRDSLGDWRKPIDWNGRVLTDALSRSAFYAERGFDQCLTNFSDAAFQESMEIAGIIVEHQPSYEGETSDELIDDDEGVQRNGAAYIHLQRFETEIRKFIDERMTAAFGRDWIKHQVHGDIKRQWIERREKAQDSGETEWPLIAYADFTDYIRILTQGDNWEKVFKPVFRRVEFVREAFQRLYPIRISTMHSRIITKDDALYMIVEIRRIRSAIGRA